MRPRADPNRTLEKFRAYTQSWTRPAAEPDAGSFRVWQTDAGPPSHSIPPHLTAKAAAAISREAFHHIHDALLHAYFAENRDITDAETLKAIWLQAGLPLAGFERVTDRALVDDIIAQHNEAVELGITGVPAVRMEGRDGFVIGAQPMDMYRRWVARALSKL